MNEATFLMICNYKGHDGTSLLDMVAAYYRERGLNNPDDLAKEYFVSIKDKFCEKVS
jgi:hypothetical protein